MSEVESERLSGRPKRQWKDGVQEILNHRGLDVDEDERHV